MVAPLKSLELTAALIIGSLSQLVGRWSMELERRHEQEVHSTEYVMLNYHIVSIAPWCIAFASVW